MEGVVIKSTGDLYNVKINNNIIRCNFRGKNKLNNIFSNPIVSGDKVKVQLIDNQSGIIEKIVKRKKIESKVIFSGNQPKFSGKRPRDFKRDFEGSKIASSLPLTSKPFKCKANARLCIAAPPMAIK